MLALAWALTLTAGCGAEASEQEAEAPQRPASQAAEATPPLHRQRTEGAAPLERIAFGSCALQGQQQPIWQAVLEMNPDLFLFIGDNIYADTEDMQVMRRKYARLRAKPGYRKLRQTCPVLSTWDDHDYGVNDGGASYPMREESAEVFLDFFDVPQSSPRRTHPGIYGAYRYGPPGRRVQVILLDTRYFKDAEARRDDPRSDEEKERQNVLGWYRPTQDTSATLLGAAQWSWLEEQLQQEASVRLIASSIQVVAGEKGMENWSNYPHERRRLYDLIESTGAGGVVFLSGDVHFSEVSRTQAGPYPLYDFTASGMTHAEPGWADKVNSHRVGQAYAERNAGRVRIAWEAEGGPRLHLETFSEAGERVLHRAVPLSTLQP